METKCAKVSPTDSKLTEALKHGKLPCQNLHTRPNLVERKIQSRIRFLGIQLINITSGMESAIPGMVDYKILMIS